MAPTILTVVDLNVSPYSGRVDNGVAGTVDGHEFDLTGNEVALVENVGVGALDITFLNARGAGGESVSDRVVNVAAAQTVAVGDFEPSFFKQSNGNCHIDFPGGSESDLQVKIIRHKRPE